MPQPFGDSVEIVVRLSRQASDAEVRAAIDEAGGTLTPPGATSTVVEPDRYASVRVPRSRADRALATLTSNPAVTAAYVKPAGQAPD